MELKRLMYQGIENKDYEIYTIGVVAKDCSFIPYGRAFRESLLEFSKYPRENSLIESVNTKKKDHGYLQVLQTSPLVGRQDIYLLEEKMIDLDTAYDCGLGIIKILKGKHQGKYFLYNPNGDNKDYFSFMIDVYLQIVVDTYNNDSINQLIRMKNGRALLGSLQFSDDIRLWHKIDMASSRKISLKDNVIPFKQFQTNHANKGE